MIKLNDLKNKINANGACVSFDYYINTGNEGNPLRASFIKQNHNSQLPIWNLTVSIPRVKNADTNIYTFDYQLPKPRPDLTLVAAVGLKYFQLHLKEEIQSKMNLDFVLGEIVEGVVG